MNNISNYFDMSVYPKDVPWYNIKNKGILGTLKDEFACENGKLNGISQFCVLRSKCYSLVTYNDDEIKKCKGVTKCEVNRFTHADFLNCNQTGKIYPVTQTTFKTHNHTIYTVNTTKDGLSNVDNKRMIDPDNILFTLPIGYNKDNDLI